MVELRESDIEMLTDTNFATFVTVNPTARRTRRSPGSTRPTVTSW